MHGLTRSNRPFRMQKALFLLTLSGALLLCGCNKQAKINSQKIDLLSQKLIQMDQEQARQMTLLQAQLTLLAPQLDKMNNTYFEKNHDDAIFFHTNTLYLLLSIDKQIEAQLQTADAERSLQDSQLYSYHTNQMGMIYLCTAQIEAALNAQESRLEDNLNAETKQTAATLQDTLQKQIILSTTPSAAEIAWHKQMETTLAQIQHDLDTIKTQLATPAAPSPTIPIVH